MWSALTGLIQVTPSIGELITKPGGSHEIPSKILSGHADGPMHPCFALEFLQNETLGISGAPGDVYIYICIDIHIVHVYVQMYTLDIQRYTNMYMSLRTHSLCIRGHVQRATWVYLQHGGRSTAESADLVTAKRRLPARL